jgi:hypothetical protein
LWNSTFQLIDDSTPEAWLQEIGNICNSNSEFQMKKKSTSKKMDLGMDKFALTEKPAVTDIIIVHGWKSVRPDLINSRLLL